VFPTAQKCYRNGQSPLKLASRISQGGQRHRFPGISYQADSMSFQSASQSQFWRNYGSQRYISKNSPTSSYFRFSNGLYSNSRPLCTLTDDPNGLAVLTTVHFFIGDSLLAPPDVSPKMVLSAHSLWMVKGYSANSRRDGALNGWMAPKWRQESDNLQVNDVGRLVE